MSVDTSNTNVAAGVDSLRAQVTGAIKQAAAVTGASFHYLLATAKMESDFNPSAGASTSSAHGLYQFIEQTWLATVKEAGAQVGYGQYANAITKTASGDYVVVDPVARRDIMKLRDDPAVSAAMAGVLTQSNSFQLTGRIGRRPTDGELYMAHFMGVGGAARLINCAVDDPQASAARMFPAAAAANRSIFYDRQGNGRTVSEVYAVIAARYDSAAGASATQSALAMYGTPATSPSAASAVGAIGAAATPALDSASFLSQIPDVRNAAPASVASASGGDANSHPADPMFRSLFLVDDRSQPVSSTVHQLWGRSASLTADAAAAAPASNNDTPRPLDLFSDRNGTFAG
ncbi:MAG TPA: transglycosylase SLT domain-containing protein [Bradyrhizobium sp.]|uniref:transglycosylase SLT domain-containing protein n=1 Tax=Bradyrhizobium sp. TaxID=376 RepID=UPI002BEBE1F2|nr:transglycosylase SLT domain-containing protein [Bradyrhizobium sp.]HLZ02677.1 transglycosylase SLT domain-containing protein [Bradyrhizobium sp.]